MRGDEPGDGAGADELADPAAWPSGVVGDHGQVLRDARSLPLLGNYRMRGPIVARSSAATWSGRGVGSNRGIGG